MEVALYARVPRRVNNSTRRLNSNSVVYVLTLREYPLKAGQLEYDCRYSKMELLSRVVYAGLMRRLVPPGYHP
jgi:hypothetical protein